MSFAFVILEPQAKNLFVHTACIPIKRDTSSLSMTNVGSVVLAGRNVNVGATRGGCLFIIHNYCHSHLLKTAINNNKFFICHS